MVLPEKWRFLVDAPFLISHKCCDVMKKEPFHRYAKETGRKGFNGTMASDSSDRKRVYQLTGCNMFDGTYPMSKPLSVWLEKDVWEYLKTKEVPYSKIYDMGYGRTGCVFCAFGVHMEKEPNRFQQMKKTHPKLWKYCMDKLGMREVLDHIGVPYE
jgi:3'-phosphoadenosine 5'-phosphosulfate sulfotransferase (PAPS reductase)/FAD synthetase